MALDAMWLQERRARSALLIVVPEVALLIDSYRQAYTADGASVPSHITLYHPFFAPDETTPEVRRRIAEVAAATPRFDFTVSSVSRFPAGLMYLAPEPADPFLDLIAGLRQEFREVSPYWDQYDEVMPHLTVADPAVGDAAAHLARIEAIISEQLPIRCAAHDIVLLQRIRPAPAPWDVQGRFPLGAHATGT